MDAGQLSLCGEESFGYEKIIIIIEPKIIAYLIFSFLELARITFVRKTAFGLSLLGSPFSLHGNKPLRKF